MNTKHMHYLLFALILLACLSPLQAQFNGGIFLDAGQEKAELSGRTWHISSKINANEPLLVGFNNEVLATGSTTELAAHFIIEPAADDGKWWTGDARWFYIRSINTGLYVTIENTNTAVVLAGQYSGTDAYKQQFRAVPSATANWYKLRSRLSDASQGYVLEVGSGGHLYAAAPHADPSADQKFAFNLALPVQPEANYSIVGINNSDYFSDNGIHATGTPAVHIKTANRSTIWNILPEADGKFSIFNPLTQQYLSVANDSHLNDELIMTGDAGDRSRWELIRDGYTFNFKNVSSGRYIGTLAQTASDQPLYEVGALGIGIRWTVFRSLQPVVQANPGAFQRIAAAPPRTDCLYDFGNQFKRALAERAGFPADPAYFPIILAAVADSVEVGKAEETLAKFNFNNPGHRVNLALLVRQYILKNIAVRPRNTWSAAEEMAVAWFEQKTHDLRVSYANRVLVAWDDYRSGKNGVDTWGMATLLTNIDADGFQWPSPYVINTFQDSLIADYVSGAATFQVKNALLQTLQPFGAAFGSVGVGMAANTAIFQAATAFKSAAALNNVVTLAAEQGTLTSLKTAQFFINLTQAGPGPLIVITVAISVLVSEAMDVAKVQALLHDIADFATRMQAPVHIDQIMQGNNELDKSALFDDLDYTMGAGPANGFQYHTNDNFYGPAFSLLCLNTATVGIDSSGYGTLSPAQIAGPALSFCGGDIQYTLTQSLFNCSEIGNHNVTLTAHNAVHSEQCNATVTVVDQTAPNVTCKNITVPLSGGAVGTAAIGASAIFQSGSDNCSPVVHLAGISSPTVYDCSHIGQHTLTLTVDDFHGNTATCQAVVTVVDNTAPGVTCKNTTIWLNPAGTAMLAPADVFQSGSDNCGVSTPQSVSKAVFSCSNLGANLVTLTANDGHGNTNTCTATVMVADNSAPTVGCPANKVVAPTSFNPVSAVVGGLGGTLSDNCSTPSLAYARSGATGGSGNGPASGLAFNAGLTTVVYTATDGAGLTSSCTFTVKVANGSIFWENDPAQGVGNATVTLGGDQSGSTATQADGTYTLNFGGGSNFTITPTKNTNKLNGLTSADVTAIQQHVANSSLLPAPFKRIAADVNKSNSITTVDASLINQALLGSPSALNQISSWRFVPAAYVFPNPDVPWGFPEKITLNGGAPVNQDFWGIKLGDVASAWANPASFGAGEPLVLRVQDRELQAGSELTAEFAADQLDDLNSLQFALRFDPEQLQLVNVEPLNGLPLSLDHFGTYDVADGEIRVVWAQEKPLLLSEAAPLFRLRFRALETGARLSEVLQLNDEALPAHVYNSAYAESGVELRYSAATDTDGADNPDNPDNREGLSVRNLPNPFTDVTTLWFVLPEAGEAELRVSDAAGRLLYSQKKHYGVGRHEETLRLDGASGVLFAELVTEAGRIVRRLLAVKK